MQIQAHQENSKETYQAFYNIGRPARGKEGAQDLQKTKPNKEIGQEDRKRSDSP